MQCIHPIFRVIGYDLVRDEQGLVRIRGSQPVESETTRKTGNGSKKTFESLRHVVRNEVLVYLNQPINAIHQLNKTPGTYLHHRDQRLFGISQLCFPANA